MVIVDYKEIRSIVASTVYGVLGKNQGNWRIVADLEDVIQNAMIAVCRSITVDPAAYGAHSRGQRAAYVQRIAATRAISYARRADIRVKTATPDDDPIAGVAIDRAVMAHDAESSLDIAKLAVVVRAARAKMSPAEREAFDAVVLECAPRPPKTRVQISRLKASAMEKVRREARSWLA